MRSKSIGRLSGLLVLLLGMQTGCTHYANMIHDGAASDCHTDVYRSSSRYADGGLRHVVVERVAHDRGLCDAVELEQAYYAVDGELERRIVEQRACGMALVRVVDTRDELTGSFTREVFEDLDEDGSFDTHRTLPTAGNEPSAGTLARHAP